MKIENKSIFLFSCLLILISIITSCEDLLIGNDDGDPRNRIAGLWLCNESDDYLKSVKETYYVEIDIHPFDSTRVYISNFFNINDDAEAILAGERLTLPVQTLKGGFTVRGSGSVTRNDNQINWEYFVDDGSGVDYRITAVYTKQE